MTAKTIGDGVRTVSIGVADNAETKVHNVLKGLVKFSDSLTTDHLLNGSRGYDLLSGFGLSTTQQHFQESSQFPHGAAQAGAG